MSKIKISDWKPKRADLLNYPPSFINWINSINNEGFQNRIKYKKYELYKQQSEDWMAETESVDDYANDVDKLNYVDKEKQKCQSNMLYACMKYLYLKEGVNGEANVKVTEVFEAQAIIMFIIDSGYNAMISKARQVGSSTIILGGCMFKSAFTPNFFLKFITVTGEGKQKELFDDKCRFAYESLPDHIRPSPGSYTQDSVDFYNEKSKGNKTQTGGKIVVAPPRTDAINGGSPALVLIDEIGLIKNLSNIISEGRPTLFYPDPNTGKLIMTRQMICWGTAGSVSEFGGAYESEWKVCKAKWEDKDFSYGIVPLFLNAYARMGFHKDFYDNEYRHAHDPNRENREEMIAKFLMAYPLTEDDLFLRTSKYLVPQRVSARHINRIADLPQKPKTGYFEPIYDESQPRTQDKYLTHGIRDVQFMETSGLSDPRTTTVIFSDKDDSYTNRFYQGTDPINSESGKSKLCSVIWDDEFHRPAAILNIRGYTYKLTDDSTGLSDLKESMREVVLLAIYYGCPPHLIETNAGSNLIEYVDSFNQLYRKLVSNAELPTLLQTSTRKIGLFNSHANAKNIIDELIELMDNYADNIDSRDFWIQMKTFAEKSQTQGKVRYQAEDLTLNRDDIIFGLVFSYICMKSYPNNRPHKKDQATGQTRIVERYDNSYSYIEKVVVDANGTVIRKLPYPMYGHKKGI